MDQSTTTVMASNFSSIYSLASQNGNPLVLLAFSALGLILLSSWSRLFGLDPKEPPEVSASVPFIGHLLGIIKYEADYFQRVRLVAL